MARLFTCQASQAFKPSGEFGLDDVQVRPQFKQQPKRNLKVYKFQINLDWGKLEMVWEFVAHRCYFPILRESPERFLSQPFETTLHSLIRLFGFWGLDL